MKKQTWYVVGAIAALVYFKGAGRAASPPTAGYWNTVTQVDPLTGLPVLSSSEGPSVNLPSVIPFDNGAAPPRMITPYPGSWGTSPVFQGEGYITIGDCSRGPC